MKDDEDLPTSNHTSINKTAGFKSLPNDLKQQAKLCKTELKTIFAQWLKYIAVKNEKTVRFPGFHTLMQRKKSLPLIPFNSRNNVDFSTTSSDDDSSDKSLIMPKRTINTAIITSA